LKNIILFFFLISAIIAQDTTKSEAFKRNLPKGKSSLHKPKYPSYPLLTGYLLQQEANNGDPFAQHELGIRLLSRILDSESCKSKYSFGGFQFGNHVL
jgi:hypothetical protein